MPHGSLFRQPCSGILPCALAAAFAVLSGFCAFAAGTAPELATVDPRQPPFNAVGRVNNSVGGRCTGVLVRPNVAITAAHCLYNRRTGWFVRPQSVHFLLGFDRGTYLFHTVAASVTIAPDYDPTAPEPSLLDDWAILHLAAPAPSTIAPMPVAEHRSGPRRVIAAGFARQRSEVLTATAPCTAEAPGASAIIVSDCAISNGLSGGPMIDADSLELVGLQVAIASRGGRPIALSIPAGPIVASMKIIKASLRRDSSDP